jgi:hypothetical protein
LSSGIIHIFFLLGIIKGRSLSRWIFMNNNEVSFRDELFCIMFFNYTADELL